MSWCRGVLVSRPSSSQSPAAQSYLHIAEGTRAAGQAGGADFHRARPGKPGNNPTRTTARPTTFRLCLLLPGRRWAGMERDARAGRPWETMAGRLLHGVGPFPRCDLALHTSTPHHHTIRRRRAWPLDGHGQNRRPPTDADAPQKESNDRATEQQSHSSKNNQNSKNP